MDALDSYSYYLEIITLIIGLIRYKEYRNFKFRYILYFLAFVVLNNLFLKIFNTNLGSDTQFFHALYALIYFVFFLLWYQSLLTNKHRKRIVNIFLIIFIVFWIYDVFLLEAFQQIFTRYSFSLGTFLLIIAVVFYFIEMLKRNVVLNITRSPYFWVSFGILVYCATYFAFYITSLILSTENPVILSVLLFLIHSMQFCCFAIAFIRADRKKLEHPL